MRILIIVLCLVVGYSSFRKEIEGAYLKSKSTVLEVQKTGATVKKEVEKLHTAIKPYLPGDKPTAPKRAGLR